MKFSEKLKELRIKNEYSQEQLAELLNVSRQAITKWESGKGMPDIDNIKAIADLFDVTIDCLLDEGESIDTSDENLCWKLSCAAAVLGFVFGWFLQENTGVNMAFWGIGGGVAGYVLGFIILVLKKRK